MENLLLTRLVFHDEQMAIFSKLMVLEILVDELYYLLVMLSLLVQESELLMILFL